MPSLSRDLGIDLGTIQTRIADSTGVLVDEPTIVAIAIDEQKIVALGKEAREMEGRVSSDTIEVARPLKNGVVADYEITEALLAYLMRRISGPMRVFRPRVMISIPYGVTSVESRAVHEDFLHTLTTLQLHLRSLIQVGTHHGKGS